MFLYDDSPLTAPRQDGDAALDQFFTPEWEQFIDHLKGGLPMIAVGVSGNSIVRKSPTSTRRPVASSASLASAGSISMPRAGRRYSATSCPSSAVCGDPEAR